MAEQEKTPDIAFEGEQDTMPQAGAIALRASLVRAMPRSSHAPAECGRSPAAMRIDPLGLGGLGATEGPRQGCASSLPL